MAKNVISLKDRMKKAGKLSAKLATDAEEIQYGVGTPSIHALNIAQRGDLHKGIVKGFKQICGTSGTFKTLISLMEGKAFLDYWIEQGEDAYILFYSNEHGATAEYFESLGIDPDRVLYVPFDGIPDLAYDSVQKLTELTAKDKIFTIIDSIGMAGSAKETEDMLAGDDKTDMSRAKKINSWVRVFFPLLIPREKSVTGINHGYMEQKQYGKFIISGGQKLYLASNEVWVMTKRQLKDGTGDKGKKIGNEFVINIDKSRFVNPLERIPIAVSFQDGVFPYSGLLDIGIDSGHIVKHPAGWFSRAAIDRNKNPKKTKKTKEADYWTKVRRTDTHFDADFWKPVLDDSTFNDYVNNRFQLGGDLNAAERQKSEALAKLDPELQIDQISDVLDEGEGEE